MSNKNFIGTAIAAIIILTIGFSSGLTLGYYQKTQAAFPQMTATSDINPGTATIRFLKFENGLLKGEISGQKSRLAYSKDGIFDLAPGESFEIPVHKVTLGQYYSNRDLPTGTQYIASKSGKYYYSIMDPRAFGITPKNRLHFSDDVEAKNKGYLPAKD